MRPAVTLAYISCAARYRNVSCGKEPTVVGCSAQLVEVARRPSPVGFNSMGCTSWMDSSSQLSSRSEALLMFPTKTAMFYRIGFMRINRGRPKFVPKLRGGSVPASHKSASK